MTEMVRVEEKEERRGRRKRSEREGEDEREESEFSLWLPRDGSNFCREERKRGETERFAPLSRERDRLRREREREREKERDRCREREGERGGENFLPLTRAYTLVQGDKREERGSEREKERRDNEKREVEEEEEIFLLPLTHAHVCVQERSESLLVTEISVAREREKSREKLGEKEIEKERVREREESAGERRSSPRDSLATEVISITRRRKEGEKTILSPLFFFSLFPLFNYIFSSFKNLFYKDFDFLKILKKILKNVEKMFFYKNILDKSISLKYP